MESKDILRVNLCQMMEDNRPSGCGYCRDIKTDTRKQTSYKYRLVVNSIPIDLYEKMQAKGWTRCGDLIYKSSYEKTCCKLYQPRLNINNFKITNEQKKIMKRFRKFLSGEYEQNKLKNKEVKPEKIKIEDNYQNKIENKIKRYINSKIYINILKKYIFNENELQIILNKINETKIRRNTNKKYNFDYSCDFIFIIKTILTPKNKKEKKDEVNQININKNDKNEYKNLINDLFKNFIEFYNPQEENAFFNEETGHINFQIKNQEEYKNYINIILNKEKKNNNNTKANDQNNKFEKNFINDLKDKNMKDNNKNKIKDKKKDKYIFDYFPEIVQEPEIYLPLKHTYTIELTNKIDLSQTEERFILYNKYQNAVHYLNSNLRTYNLNWGLSILSKSKKVPIPENFNEKTKHPEIYPQYYGTYNLIHRIDGKIIAVTVWDILPHSLESVYCYYDPDYSFLDLGVFTTIREIEYMKSFQNLIDKNFMYYSMGEMSQSCQKLRYKGNYWPTEIMDHYTGEYVLLTEEMKNLIGDNKCHHLVENNGNPPVKYFNDIEIEDKYWNLMVDVFGDKVFFDDFLNLYLEGNENYKNILISAMRRFLEIIDSETFSQIEFYYDTSAFNN